MALTRILVHMDSNSRASSRLALAAGYAARHGARLIGVYADAAGPRNSEETAAAFFLDETDRAGIRAEWLGADKDSPGTDEVQFLNYYCRATDLVITGQPPADSRSAKRLRNLPERLVLSCGRPVMIVPHAGDFASCGERVLVAWNNGRESSRALHDALPILRQAQRVHLLRVLMASDSGIPSGAPGSITAFLAGHGIKARPEEILAPNFPLGELLLNHACEEGTDLLVMGAYGLSLTGRPVIGKAAKHILRHLTLPVLMSH
ncbi:MAG: universal stress protein [Geobacteraceae bacterium]|nr:universal stress protein [Geobacteraceae bacterium]